MTDPKENPTNSANNPSDEPVDIGEVARHRHAHTEAYPLSDEQAMEPKEKYEDEQRAQAEADEANAPAETDAPAADEPPAPTDAPAADEPPTTANDLV